MFKSHGNLERHSILLLLCILVVVAIGGIVEITPLFYLESTIEEVDGMRPYTPLELAGRETAFENVSRLLRSPFIAGSESAMAQRGQWDGASLCGSICGHKCSRISILAPQLTFEWQHGAHIVNSWLTSAMLGWII
mgnify:CR=1 FL=1